MTGSLCVIGPVSAEDRATTNRLDDIGAERLAETMELSGLFTVLQSTVNSLLNFRLRKTLVASDLSLVILFLL